ncbi:MAG TPA: DsbE family thiol:disulfide interchange protein [Rhodocyclaceae bacterium]|nr:DsbE family thiol:disulfide interchange protein [Rhodocyclaceae bacterium]HMV53210.1 DsbE family thiol:disulfide interchange protein [Rhodocyclaceae bacterium]HNA02432.1 DsbE family thiol:disulfide interchange protein [Rhodocyclaceae bacterium]HNB77481.1 DsbE family thiol:disulfide interchange protein [Rhodocyclaceae bacterium]HNC60024.1 DsbE family thiol:disulfide interchange protein [Rhodocyclaceae bacterium]
MGRYLIPLGIFVVLVGFLAVGLNLNPREVPSPLIDKPAPAFSVSQLHQADKTIARDDLKGKVWLLNVWASWCVSCRQEHPVLVDLAKSGAVPIYGLNYKDQREAGLKWLAEHGNPYVISAFDHDGRVGIDYGVYGVPETFLIDKAGVIRYKHIGPVTPDALKDIILPKVKELNAAS